MHDSFTDVATGFAMAATAKRSSAALVARRGAPYQPSLIEE
jgi:hypothetical protein